MSAVWTLARRKDQLADALSREILHPRGVLPLCAPADGGSILTCLTVYAKLAGLMTDALYVMAWLGLHILILGLVFNDKNR